jgi:site-specific recombinase XerD
VQFAAITGSMGTPRHMASIYPRKKTLWIKYRDIDGQIKRESTHLRADDPVDVRRAKKLAAEKTAMEQQYKHNPKDSNWDHWVPQFIAARYKDNPEQKQQIMQTWIRLRDLLKLVKADHPAQLRYAHVADMVEKMLTGKSASGRNLKVSSIGVYLSTLAVIMDEAIRREFTENNPVRQIELPEHTPKVKKEILPEHMEIIRHAVLQEPQWMQIQFAIATHTGCRLSECYQPVTCINLDRQEFHFAKVKSRKPYTIPIHQNLIPLFQRIISSGQSHTFIWPGIKKVSISARWSYFFERLKLPYTFHCFRVTFINQGRRAGIDRFTMMKLVGHNSPSVHSIYSRWEVDKDLKPALEKLQLPAPALPPASYSS